MGLLLYLAQPYGGHRLDVRLRLRLRRVGWRRHLGEKQNAGWVGTACGVGTLVTVAFLASWVSFFREGLPKVGANDDPFVDTTSSPAWPGVPK